MAFTYSSSVEAANTLEAALTSLGVKAKGYQTAAIGKWHLGWDWSTKNGMPPVDNKDECNVDYSMKVTGGPTSIGFDYFFGMDAPNYPPYTYIENDKVQGTPSVFYPSQPYEDCRPGTGVEGWNLENIMPDLQQASVGYISKASSSGKPFFLYLPITAPHTPIAPEKSLIIIDEPEIHINKSISAYLFDRIESTRPDCAFIYITHDIDFSRSRSDSKFYILKKMILAKACIYTPYKLVLKLFQKGW